MSFVNFVSRGIGTQHVGPGFSGQSFTPGQNRGQADEFVAKCYTYMMI